ncbi:MAG TPA: endonuclease/exonuclease/phosphatase family protein, partial [Solirubrobacteraceae bacterium]
ILTWNLYHGRAVPTAGRDLFVEFARLLAEWDWDVALLQEVPPWWPARLASATGAEQRTALTSRNAALPLRRLLAERWPDQLKSNGGGSNAILARQGIVEHHALRLRMWPERRVAQLARLADGATVVNLHGSTRVPLAEAELGHVWDRALKWSGQDPLILGGDLNLRDPSAPRDDVIHLAGWGVDHIFALRLRQDADARRLERRVQVGESLVELSDHTPLLASARPVG